MLSYSFQSIFLAAPQIDVLPSLRGEGLLVYANQDDKPGSCFFPKEPSRTRNWVCTLFSALQAGLYPKGDRFTSSLFQPFGLCFAFFLAAIHHFSSDFDTFSAQSAPKNSLSDLLTMSA